MTKTQTILSLGALALVAAFCDVARAGVLDFQSGDVMVSHNTAPNTFDQWRKDGNGVWQKIQSLANSSAQPAYGSAFDSAGNFYGAEVSAIQKFTGPLAPHVSSTLTNTLQTDYSILFSGAGDMYVGRFGGAGGIRKLDSTTGAVLATYAVGQSAFNIALAADGHTMYYTRLDGAVHRVDLATNTVLADFAASTVDSGHDLRFLADGTLLVSDNLSVKRLDGSGAILQSYDIAGTQLWQQLSLDSDGNSFWAVDGQTQNVWKFNVTTGATQGWFYGGGSADFIGGISVFGAYSATSVPLPGAAWLGIAMLAGLGALQYRRRRALS